MIEVEEPIYRRVLVDAGPLVAIYNEKDQFHHECREALAQILPPLLTSWLVIAEVAYLLLDSPDSVENLMTGPATGMYRILPLTEVDFLGMASLFRKYRKMRPQLADISLVHLASRETISTVFTLDRRDFSAFRNAQGKMFRLLPEISRRRRR